ncbi:hypothetical protein BJX99DRAFT_220272 [Aspergillus californicus]
MLSLVDSLVKRAYQYLLPLVCLLRLDVLKVGTRTTPLSDIKSSETSVSNKQVSKHASALASINGATENDPVLAQLKHLVDTDGAGTWPPRASHGDTWPSALRPYHEIYLEVAPFLATEDIVLDDSVNAQRIDSFRERLTTLLTSRVDLPSAVETLSAAEDNMDNEAFHFASYNGFSACIATLRHAFRWGVIPVVRAAQEQKLIDFPVELDLPWEYIRRRYGFTSQGGNVMTNYFCNFDEQDRIVYQVNGRLTERIQTAEYNFAHIFIAVERLALPIYLEITNAITHYTHGNNPACLSSLRRINTQFSNPPRIFYRTLNDTHISPEIWMRYVQGFPGWAAGEVISGEYTEYDGLSGSHSLFFRVADAFLGIPAYFSEESNRRYVPAAQRGFCDAIREFGLREKAKESGEMEIEREIERMALQLRTFRCTHRSRIHKYLSAPAPERLIMTAGKSVLESDEIPEIETAITHLGGILRNRIKETR